MGGEGEGEGESLVGEVEVEGFRCGREMSEVVEVGDSGLSCFTSSTLCLLLLLLRIASIEKEPKLLFSPIFSKDFSSTGLLSLSRSFYTAPHPSLPVRGERESNKWSERTSGARRCPQIYRTIPEY